MSGINVEGKVQYVNIGTPSISLRDEFLLYHPKRELGHLNKRGGVSNDKDATYLILGDEDVESLVHVSCCTSASLPPIFNLLLGKELLFLVEKRSRINDLREACSKVRRVCGYREIIRMFSTGHFFCLDHNIRSTIARLLGEQGASQHFNNFDGSSYASDVPGDNFTSAGSFLGQPSFSASVPFNNHGTNMSKNGEADEPTDKECVYFTSNDE
ncbi:hypothetical protein SESBI_49605 [Sesbania bispinosa]|nr:hypothetical protein SESBI_49605 [Sesbania bispinosa]